MQPTSAEIALSPDFVADLEQYEGMAITLTSGTDDPLTVIENFDLDRFGEITLSAGTQVQPTQIYDPTTELDEIHALQEANAQQPADHRRRLVRRRTRTSTATFRPRSATTATAISTPATISPRTARRSGSAREMTEPIEGVLTFNFGEYKMLVDGTLPIDEATNAGAREDEPEDVGGTADGRELQPPQLLHHLE